jgi:hypothetical protein
MPGRRPPSLEVDMRKLLTRNWFLILLSTFILGSGITMTVYLGHPFWSAVAGSILTGLGAVAACRKFIRLGFQQALTSNMPMSGGAILPTQEDLDHARQADLDDRASILACTLIVIGTPLQIIGYLMSG